MKQKNVFLESEGDAWYERNVSALNLRKLPEEDPLLLEILNLPLKRGATILEIGCGDGARLGWLRENLECDCYGVEPSKKAVEVANGRNITVYQGAADKLPFNDKTFDVIIFGFCLYLCDREDLFRIAAEADRVVRNTGWILIQDFYSPTPLKREYHHLPGLFSYKMDYRTLFTWHPEYTNFVHKVCHHSEKNYTDDPIEWVATSVIRKAEDIIK